MEDAGWWYPCDDITNRPTEGFRQGQQQTRASPTPYIPVLLSMPFLTEALPQLLTMKTQVEQAVAFLPVVQPSVNR